MKRFALNVLASGSTLIGSLACGDTPASYIDLRLSGGFGSGDLNQPLSPTTNALIDVEDGLGWGLRGAWQLAPGWRAYGDWSTLNTGIDVSAVDATNSTSELLESDFDLDRISLGVEHLRALSPALTVYARISWDFIDYGDFDSFDVGNFNDVQIPDSDDNGAGFSVGGLWTTGQWHLEAWLRHSEASHITSKNNTIQAERGLGAGLRSTYDFSDSWSLGEDYEGTDVDSWSVFLRYRFR